MNSICILWLQKKQLLKLLLRYKKHLLLLPFLWGLNSPKALAQQAPDAGALQNEIEATEQQIPENIPELPKPPAPPESPQGTPVPVTRFLFEGNSLLNDAALNTVVDQWRNKPLTIAELKYVTDLVAAAYRAKGYLARVFLPEQNINAGEIRVVVVEAQFGDVRIDGDAQKMKNEIIDPNFALNVVYQQQQKDKPLRVDAIERSTLLLNDLAGVSAKSVLVASEQPGHTDVALKVEPTAKYRGSVRVDNFGVRSTGEARLLPSFQVANPLRRGDALDFLGLITEGNQYLRTGYLIPVLPNGLKVGGNLSYLHYELGDAFKALDANGDALTVGINASYPLIRQLQKNLNIDVSLAQRSYSDSQLGEEVAEKKIVAFTAGINGDYNDGLWGGGINSYSVEAILGDLDLSGNPINEAQDALDAKTAGDYLKIAVSAARMQYVRDDTYLWFAVTGQFGSRNLDSSETISLGGPNGVRAYSSLEGTGDSGLILNLEARRRVGDDLMLSVFYDHGVVNQRRTVTQDKATESLQGLGISLDWTVAKDFSGRITIARRLGSNPFRDPETGNDSNGEKELWPVWVSVSRTF